MHGDKSVKRQINNYYGNIVHRKLRATDCFDQDTCKYLRGLFKCTRKRAVYLVLINEPRHEKTCLSHMRTTKVQISLRIRTFFFRYLHSIVPILAKSKMSKL